MNPIDCFNGDADGLCALHQLRLAEPAESELVTGVKRDIQLLERIRDIRASEKRFYQKVRDLFALSSDYQARERETAQFFAEVQNKLLYATTGHTAAELILKRSDPDQPNMALTSWSGSDY
jgi:hypothetical protein